ncbi:hypothetical protein AAC387_Pa02g4522 [Persea americana]
MDPRLFVCVCVFVHFISQFNSFSVAQSVGVNYGMKGNNLPTADQVIALVKSKNITRIRLFDPNPDALKALQGSGVETILGTLNEDLPKLGSDPSFATNWVNTNVVPHANSVVFRYVSAGNEVIPGDLAANVLPAMKNLDSALKAAKLSIPVSTCVATQVLGVSYPPSQGAFSEAASSIMAPIAAYLEANKIPLLVNVYPYFAYAGSPGDVRLDYALFTAKDVVVRDGGLAYYNLFDAIVDSVYSALEKAGGPSVEVVVAETGWPSAGNGNMATISNAETYNNNLIAHLSQSTGTPKRPGKAIETYMFAIFNENLKPAGTEQNFGLYQPDMTAVYPVNFSP